MNRQMMFKEIISRIHDLDFALFDNNVKQIALGVNCQVNRFKTVKKLFKITNFWSIAYNIERGLFKSTVNKMLCSNVKLILFKSIYDEQLLNIMDAIKTQKITIENSYYLAFLQPYELQPDKWDKLIQKKKKSEELLTKPTFYINCKKCSGKGGRVYQLQTRKADEPMTTYVKCCTCKHIYTL